MKWFGSLWLTIRSWNIRQRLTAAGAIFIVGYGAFQLYLWRLRTESLDSAANKILQGFHNQDTGVLWFYTDPVEKLAYDMDYRKFDRLYREYVFPRVYGLARGPLVPNYIAGGQQYTALQTYTQGDVPIYYDLVVQRTKLGPKAALAQTGILFGIQAKYAAPFAKKPGKERIFGTWKAGITADRATLEHMGFHGISKAPMADDLTTWDQMLKSAELTLSGWVPE